MQLHIRGRVTNAYTRFEAGGKAVVVLDIEDVPTGQCIRARHLYPDASNASGFAARALASRLRGQLADFDAINPRFRAKRLECEAPLITTPEAVTAGQTRKDLE